VEQNMIKYAHKHKVKICVWTVNTKEEQEKLVKWGVDSITSNFILPH
jgi:glycerophosphoryl diester phosphodiesterase